MPPCSLETNFTAHHVQPPRTLLIVNLCAAEEVEGRECGGGGEWGWVVAQSSSIRAPLGRN